MIFVIFRVISNNIKTPLKAQKAPELIVIDLPLDEYLESKDIDLPTEKRNNDTQSKGRNSLTNNYFARQEMTFTSESKLRRSTVISSSDIPKTKRAPSVKLEKKEMQGNEESSNLDSSVEEIPIKIRISTPSKLII